ncbi:MAG TPA: AraC family transcriptional regulator [Candidatus Blautia stercoravium]|nr:AraC family transcriptional regulator [Candidatus Blautia stercoravium]
MFSQESLVTPESEYFIYTASFAAKKLFFYPTYVGNFQYEPGYILKRSRYDSFLIMLITDGTCKVSLNGHHYTAPKDSLVLIDCYAPHEYGNSSGHSSLWLHFDGPMARNYYEYLIQKWGHVILPPNVQSIKYHLEKIYKIFKTGQQICEASISSQITLLLNELMDTAPLGSTSGTQELLKNAITYINEHFAEPVHLEAIAEKASLSPFYFTRIFARETGMTPYRYLIATRISAAKFLLKSTSSSVKEIALSTGFSSESSFCSAFKKYEHTTPSNYRKGK